MHLGIEPKQVLAAVEEAGDDEIELDRLLGEFLPEDLKVVVYVYGCTRDRKSVVQP